MRVLAVNDEPEAGGAAQLFRRTNHLLRRAGHEVIEFTGASCQRGEAARWGGRLGRLQEELALNFRQVFDPRMIERLGRVLDETPVDVAHVHNLHGRLSTGILPFLKRRGIPIVYQVNDYFFFCNSYVAYNRWLDQPCKRCIRSHIFWAVRYGCVNNLGPPRMDRAFLQTLKRLALVLAKPWKSVDVFLVTSEQTAALLEEWGVVREQQRNIFNPVVLEEFNLPRSLGDEVVFYGTCLPSKGTETFLAALEYVEPSCHIGVYLSGMTPFYERRLCSIAERRGIRMTVDSSLRWNTGLKERIASSRAVIVPSQWWVTSESVVYEGLLLGKPVVVSRMGGNMELVDHGETGFLFEPRNGRQLAEYINVLSADRELADRMGSEAHRRASQRFSESAFLQLLEAAYGNASALATRHE